jgi:hypothetical protein
MKMSISEMKHGELASLPSGLKPVHDLQELVINLQVVSETQFHLPQIAEGIDFV